MKTLSKTEAVRAFLDGKRVEFRKLGKWYAIKSYSMFDQDLSFRLADTDDDAEYIRNHAASCNISGYHQSADKWLAIASRIERDKARISELERWKSEMLEVERVQCELEALQKWKEDMQAQEATWDEQAVGRELGIWIGHGTIIRAHILEAVRKVKAERDRAIDTAVRLEKDNDEIRNTASKLETEVASEKFKKNSIQEQLSDRIAELERCKSDAADVLDEIRRDDSNSTDEAEKWLRAYAPEKLTAQDDNQWIPHDGGPMPCDGKLVVDVKLHDGNVLRGTAITFRWRPSVQSYARDITAWRPAKGGDK